MRARDGRPSDLSVVCSDNASIIRVESTFCGDQRHWSPTCRWKSIAGSQFESAYRNCRRVRPHSAIKARLIRAVHGIHLQGCRCWNSKRPTTGGTGKTRTEQDRIACVGHVFAVVNDLHHHVLLLANCPTPPRWRSNRTRYQSSPLPV